MANFKGLIKRCECCGAEFKVPQSHAHIRACSRECGYKIRLVANKKEKVELKCAHCGKTFLEHESHAGRRRFCSFDCMFSNSGTLKQRSENIAGERNPSWKGGVTVKAVSSSGKAYSRQQPHLENEKSVRRKRSMDKATPDWADLDKVRMIYKICREISRETGVQHHVDHAVPLTSKKVCGLHNEFNLRVMPGIENLRKQNRSWPDMW